eukprot:CAMPEP_0202976062 /NCGR_PEP_ID=MMETSP1396-20130829/74038_1 /ASSEMBLY_ACC=CAM_ASM_000872 /TAXON_ID= /ORGANISM="Pseudokeronopsis sp., Strain Brazil" /LENGTH=156 /DNA_ID=CAMNT_0049712713 /DNA_START=203 /DNA_END=676 /DNA_ORIENTATION=+
MSQKEHADDEEESDGTDARDIMEEASFEEDKRRNMKMKNGCLEEDLENEYGDEDEDREQYLDDQDEDDEVKEQLIIPSDVDGEEEEEEVDEVDEDEAFQEFKDIAPEPKEYANKELIRRIEKLEDKMVKEKGWQMKGEVLAKDRPIDSLLEEHLDF